MSKYNTTICTTWQDFVFSCLRSRLLRTSLSYVILSTTARYELRTNSYFLDTTHHMNTMGFTFHTIKKLTRYSEYLLPIGFRDHSNKSSKLQRPMISRSIVLPLSGKDCPKLFLGEKILAFDRNGIKFVFLSMYAIDPCIMFNTGDQV